MQGGLVPDPGVRSGQVQVHGGPLAEFGPADLASVHLRHMALAIEDGQHDRSGHVFLTVLADDADLLEPFTDDPAVGLLLFGDAHANGAIGEADLESGNGLFIE